MSPPRPLRIAAHNGAPVWGGAEVALTRLLVGLQERGHEVTLFCNREVVADPAREAGLPVRLLHLGGDVALHHGFRFGAALRRLRPDALVVGTFRKLLLAAGGARVAGVPNVVARIGLSTDVPRNAKYRFVLRRWVDHVVLVTDDLRPAYEAALPGFDRDRLVTIYKGFRPLPRRAGPGAVRRELGLDAGTPVIGSVGRIARQKRYDRLLDALARLPDEVRLILAGDGPERPSLEARAERLGLAGRVHWLGFRTDVADVLAALDVFVLPSDREAMANVVLEAMQVGVPVVATGFAGAREALEPLEDGVAPGVIVGFDVDAVATAVERLLRDRDLRARMARAGTRRVRERFVFDRMLERWEAVLAGRSPGPPA